MLKDMVEYIDIDGNKATKTVFFNLTQYEVEAELELEEMQARFQKFMDEVIGDDVENPIREMTSPEKREMFRMVKTLVKYAYGVREGKRFIKNNEIWDEFEQTGAFSAFMYQLFLQKDAVNRFMAGIWPQGVDRQTPPGSALSVVPDAPDPLQENVEREGFTGTGDAPDEKPWYDYSKVEMDALSDDEFDSLVRRSKRGNNVPAQLLVIGQQRKSRTTGGETE